MWAGGLCAECERLPVDSWRLGTGDHLKEAGDSKSGAQGHAPSSWAFVFRGRQKRQLRRLIVGQAPDRSMEEAVYICLCKGIRETEFEGIVIQNGGYPDGVKQAMGLDEECCGRCETNLEGMIQDTGIGVRPLLNPFQRPWHREGPAARSR